MLRDQHAGRHLHRIRLLLHRPPEHAMDDRFNLWIITGKEAAIVCYGSRSEMNDIALSAGIPASIHVLPDGCEPFEPETLPLPVA